MNKPELIEAISDKAGVPKKMAQHLLDTTVSVIRETLLSGERVKIAGLGIFYVKQYQARAAINPNTGLRVMLKPRKVVRCKIAQDLNREVNQKQGGKK
jgi:nucleoid DNA-binding protein